MSATSSGDGRSSSLHVDLVVVGLAGLWLVGLAAVGVGAGPVQPAIGLIALLFAPGYALVAVLYPARSVSDTDDSRRVDGSSGTDDSRGVAPGVASDGTVTVVERLVLAIAFSLCLVPLLGLGLAYTPSGLGGATVLPVVGSMTVLLAIVAWFRRGQLPVERRFAPGRVGFSAIDTVGERVRTVRARPLVVVLVLCYVVAAGGIGYAALSTDPGEQFTEFHITTEADGEQVADGYPTLLSADQVGTLDVGITNNEDEAVEYGVAVLAQSVDAEGTVTEQEQVDAFSATVDDGASWEQPHELEPESWDQPPEVGSGLTDERLRVVYLLYRDPSLAESDPDPETAYRSVHLWVEVD